MEDISKLTIPKLKALCKEKKLTGYSKLNKPGLIAKLLEHQGSGTDTGGSNVTGAAARPSKSVVVAEPTTKEPSVPGSSLSTAAPVVPSQRDGVSPGRPSSQAPLNISITKPRSKKPKQIAKPSATHTSSSNHSIRVSHVPEEPPAVSTTTSLVPSLPVHTQARVEPLSSLSPKPVKRKSDAPAEAPKAKKLKPAHKVAPVPVGTNPKLPLPHPVPQVIKDGAPEPGLATRVYKDGVNRQAATDPSLPKASKKAFTPLLPKVPPVKVPGDVAVVPPAESSVSGSRSVVSDTSFEFPTDDTSISLRPVSLPPSISQRKKVQRLSMLFSLLNEEDLAVFCGLCRLYRYSGAYYPLLAAP